ncbi:DNA internalization-related competence protein ComEC/Rec2 [Salinibacillus aidingensis]
MFSIWNEYLLLWLGLWVFLFISYILYKNRPGSWLFFFFSSVLLIYFSLLPPFESSLWKDHSHEESTLIQGTITSNPSIKEGYISLTLEETNTSEKLLINIYSEQSESLQKSSYQHGAKCTVTGKMKVPEEARNPGAFDYRSYLKSMGIYLQMNIQQKDIHCVGKDWMAYPLQVKNHLLQFLKEQYTDESYHWIQALIFGDKDFLSEEIIQEFQHWNLSHLLAISGLHAGLIILFIYTILNRVCKLSIETSRYIIMIFLPVYAVFASGNPPVLRAVMMAELLFIFSILGRRWPVTDVVSITAILLLLQNPLLIYQLGFQFSFLVTFSLIMSGNILRRLPSYLWTMIYISFISQMVLIPLQILNFYYISPLSIFANLFFVPYFSALVIPVSLIAVLFSWLPPPFTDVIDFYFSRFHEPMLVWLLNEVKEIQLLWVIGEISVIAIIAYFAGLFLFMKLLEVNQKMKALFTATLLIVLLIVVQLQPYLDSKGTVTMLDVGQGDTIVIELPYREGVVMIDAAKEMSLNKSDEKNPGNPTAEYAIKPYLWSKGITTIDHLIVTHFDQDHFGSYTYLQKHFNIDQLYTNPDFEEFLPAQPSLNPHILTKGMKLMIDDYIFHVLSPHDEGTSPLDQNNRSIVLYTKLGDRTWLFTGDIGSETEREIIADYPELQVDILKVPHHGSKYSSSQLFLEALRPDFALISAGEHNLYGHPAPETLARLQQNHTKILRTDIHGAIQYRFHKMGSTFRTMNP